MDEKKKKLMVYTTDEYVDSFKEGEEYTNWYVDETGNLSIYKSNVMVAFYSHNFIVKVLVCNS